MPARGAVKTLRRRATGPVPTLRTQQVEIKYKKPTPGGRSKVRKSQRRRTGASLTQRFFFAGARFQPARRSPRADFAWQFKAPRRRARAISAFVFPRPPGGRSKVRDLSIADRWVRHAYFVANLRKSFFAALLGSTAQKKRREIQGGGVGQN